MGRRKRNAEANVQRYKARFVAKSYTQQYGIYYDGTFSSVAQIQSIQVILALVTFYDYALFEMDVKITLLNGNTDKQICMIQPERYTEEESGRKVCKLNKLIYRLTQTSR